MLIRTAFTMLAVLLSATAVSAQTLQGVSPDSLPHITRDARIDLLVRAHAKQNRNSEGIEGYRVQVFSGSGNEARQQANNIRRQLLASNPELASHLVYQPPNFKVRVGDCRTEFEAIRIKRDLAFHYPQGFVVKDVIKLPPLSIDATNGRSVSESPEGILPAPGQTPGTE